MASRSFRSALASKSNRLSIRQIGKIIGAKKAAKRAEKEIHFLKSEPELIQSLGEGPHFVVKVFRQFRPRFEDLQHDPKRCSAYLNLVVNSRMLDDGLWTDKAVESMFRRALPKGSKS
jgi:hypothetical protein